MTWKRLPREADQALHKLAANPKLLLLVLVYPLIGIGLALYILLVYPCHWLGIPGQRLLDSVLKPAKIMEHFISPPS